MREVKEYAEGVKVLMCDFRRIWGCILGGPSILVPFILGPYSIHRSP